MTKSYFSTQFTKQTLLLHSAMEQVDFLLCFYAMKSNCQIIRFVSKYELLFMSTVDINVFYSKLAF